MEDKIKIGLRIKQRREELGLTQEKLGKELSLNKSTIQRYEAGTIQKIKCPVLEAIASVLKVNPDWLALKTDDSQIINQQDIFSIDNILPLPKTKKVPLIGSIACGEPILADENIETYINLDEGVRADFALRCKGDSMINARILDGDIVYIRQQASVENGEIAAVLIDNEATLKRIYYYPEKNMLILKPENSKYEDFVYTNEELNEIRILGKAVAFLSNV